MALAFPTHLHHRSAMAWFRTRGHIGFRTCPLTQLGFVRLCARPEISGGALAVSDGRRLLEQVVGLPGHQFWPDDLPVTDVLAAAAVLTGHRQLTDAYLVALARGRDGCLATFDEGCAVLAPSEPDLVETIEFRA